MSGRYPFDLAIHLFKFSEEFDRLTDLPSLGGDPGKAPFLRDRIMRAFCSGYNAAGVAAGKEVVDSTELGTLRKQLQVYADWYPDKFPTHAQVRLACLGAKLILNDYADTIRGRVWVDRSELDALRQACRYAELHLDLPHPEIELQERASVLKALAAALGRPNHPVRTRAADPAPTLPAQPKPENSMSNESIETINGKNRDVLVFLFNELQAKAHANSRDKGFWDPANSIENIAGQHKPKTALAIAWKLSRIALMHSELSEALEGIRKGLMDDHLPHRSMEVCELADTVIRILDYADGYSLPLMEVILEKMAYNSTREFMHGKQA